MYAVIRTGGKQHRVTQGESIDIELLDAKIGDTVQITDVLAIGEGESMRVGQPTVAGASVALEIISEVKGPKTLAFKKLKRQGKQWKKGHRQQFLRARVSKISA